MIVLIVVFLSQVVKDIPELFAIFGLSGLSIGAVGGGEGPQEARTQAATPAMPPDGL